MADDQTFTIVCNLVDDWGKPLAGGVICGILAAQPISASSFAAIWPANALVVALLLFAPRGTWHRYLLAALASLFASCASSGSAFTGSALFAIAHAGEIALAAYGLRRRFKPSTGLFHDRASLMHFLVWSGGIAPGFGALFGAAAAALPFNEGFDTTLAGHFCAEALGLVLFTPFYANLLSGDFRRCLGERSAAGIVEALLLQGLVLASGIIFLQHQLPLLFVPFMPLMLVTFRLGWTGTSLSILLVAYAAVESTVNSDGPLALIAASPAVKLLFLQFYLICIILVIMPVAATLMTKRTLIDRLQKDERMIELLAASSSVSLLIFDGEGCCTQANGQTQSMLAATNASLPGLSIEDIFPASPRQCREAFNASLAQPSGKAGCEITLADGRHLDITFDAHGTGSGSQQGALAMVMEATARRNEFLRLSHLARTDALTGVLNRAGFLDVLYRAMAELDAHFCVALIDFDHFKRINDACGHLVGDAALKHVSAILTDMLRSVDAVARLGGDEFVVLISHARLPYATSVCERLVCAVAENPIKLPDGTDIALSISCGLAEHAIGEAAERLIDRADMALYAAKGGGRNCLRAA